MSETEAAILAILHTEIIIDVMEIYYVAQILLFVVLIRAARRRWRWRIATPVALRAGWPGFLMTMASLLPR